MQCYSHFFSLVVFCFFCCIYGADPKATLLTFEKCNDEEGTNKYEIDYNLSDGAVSGTANLLDDITNDYQVQMEIKKKMGDGLFAPFASINFDNIKEPLDHVAKAWEKTREAFSPKISEAYDIPAAKYELRNHFISKDDIKLPINEPGNYLVMIKLFNPTEEEVACLKFSAAVE